jgi:D-alanyl-D-alanine carboxypeptidase/D-alanyl-D-alanine-endopeptidase (penicillin-binding protein 4)
MRYGPEATINTTLRVPAVTLLDPATGILPGDIYLVGAGDPTLDDTGLRTLARRLRAAGVRQIDGGVIADEHYFDNKRGTFRTSWKADYDIAGQLSALAYRHGRPASAVKAAERLKRLIEATGTTVAGDARRGRLGEPGTELASVASPTIANLVRMINVPSENFYAEMLAKQLGAAFGSGGTTTAGVAVIRSTLTQSAGISPTLTDGSGLSRRNRTSARQLVRLLETLHADPIAGIPFAGSLPRFGQDGTLKRRMRGSTAAGNCAAKTGTLIGVSSLSGYCTTATGGTVAFAMIENRVNSGGAKEIEDRVVARIARYG